MSLTKVSNHIAAILSKELSLVEDQAEIIAYGLEIVLGSVTKLVVILLSAYFLGIFSTTLVALLTFSFFRLLSGGVHFSHYKRCLGFGLIIILSMGKAAQVMVNYLALNLTALTFFAGLFVFFMTLKWGPAENPNKSLSAQEIAGFKVASASFTVIWLVLMQAILAWDTGVLSQLVVASALALLVQAFTLTPQAYKAVGYANRMIDGERKGGVEYV